MNKIEFVCTLNEITQSLNITMDSELVAKIYDLYHYSYENYTLLELIRMLKMQDIEITCAWNKKAIIRMIEQKSMTANVPKKSEPMEPTKWHYRCIKRSLDIIKTDDTGFEFYDGCIIKLPDDDTLYEIEVFSTEELISKDLPKDSLDSYKEVVYVLLCEDDELVKKITADEFIHMLDYEDVTIIQCINDEYYM